MKYIKAEVELVIVLMLILTICGWHLKTVFRPVLGRCPNFHLLHLQRVGVFFIHRVDLSKTVRK